MLAALNEFLHSRSTAVSSKAQILFNFSVEQCIHACLPSSVKQACRRSLPHMKGVAVFCWYRGSLFQPFSTSVVEYCCKTWVCELYLPSPMFIVVE